jgi:hypothetical protein
MRCPAWCDRVLWAAPRACSAGPVQRMSLEDYRSSGPYVSDHAPVCALFALTLLYTDPQQDRVVSRSAPDFTRCEKNGKRPNGKEASKRPCASP